MDAGTRLPLSAVSLCFGIINNNSRIPAKELQKEAVKNI